MSLEPHNDNVYFTTTPTNGHVVIFNSLSHEQVGVYDINSILEESGFKAGGWCRGVLPIANGNVLVGYTQLRHTKFKEFVSFAKRLGEKIAPTRIIEVDLDKNIVVDEYEYSDLYNKGAAIFSIIKY